MLTSTIKRNAFRVLATLAFAAAPAFASMIIVNNFSFETPPIGGFPTNCGTGCNYSTAAIPDWGGTAGVAGQWQTGGLFISADPAGGPTSAFVNDHLISQTVGETVSAGLVYTLLVDIGLRTDSGSFAGTADLLIGGSSPHTIAATGLAPTLGGWSTFTATYIGSAADAGASITIELRSAGIDPNGIQHQGNFDNVRLDPDPVPEPASFLLIGSALLALKAFRRRRPIA